MQHLTLQSLADGLEQHRDAFAGYRRQPYGPPLPGPVAGHPGLAAELVDLVVDADLRHAIRIELAEHRVDLAHALPAIAVTGIDEVQNQVGFARLLQRRTERRDQLVRQVPDEAHRVGQHDGASVGQFEAADRRVQRREKLVLDVDARIGERIEQGRLAGIRVAHQRHGGHLGTDSVLAIHRAAGVHVLEPFAQLLDAAADQAAVCFELRFARAAQPDAAFLPLEVGPAADQARGKVPELRELDLQLAFEAARALCENIQDQACPVEHAAIEFAFEVAFLARGQRSRGYHELGFVIAYTRLEFVELAFADEEARIGLAPCTDDLADDQSTRRYGQLAELLAFGVVRRPRRTRVDKNCTFAALRSFKQT